MRPRAAPARKDWAGIARETVRSFFDDQIPGRAAQMSFYFFLSVFPTLLILMAGLGIFLDAQWLIRGALLDRLTSVAPNSIVRVFNRLLDHVADHSGGPLTFGVLVAAWAASSGMVSLIRGLNVAYGVDEERPWWKRRVVGAVLTLVFLVLLTVAMMVLAYGLPMAANPAGSTDLSGAFPRAWQVAQWPVIFAFVLLAFDILYHFAPHRPHVRWRWIQAGTVVAITLWLLASLGLKFYVANFAKYNMVYGSVGAVIVVLLWFYLTGIAILTGAKINAQSEALEGAP